MDNGTKRTRRNILHTLLGVGVSTVGLGADRTSTLKSDSHARPTAGEPVIEWNAHIFSPDVKRFPIHPQAVYKPDVSKQPADPLVLLKR